MRDGYMLTPVRVLQLTYSLKAAGIETFVVNLYKNIDRNKIQFDFVSYFEKEKKEFYDDTVEVLGAKVFKLGYKKRSIMTNLLTRKNLYYCIKKNHYDIIHIHGSTGISLLDAAIAKLAGVKRIIIHSHNSSVSSKAKLYHVQMIMTWIARKMWRFFATDYLACSKEAALWLFGKAIQGNVKIIENGIDDRRFRPDPELNKKWRAENHISYDTLLIGHVGGFIVAKNHFYVLDIFHNVYQKDKDARFILIGDGPKRSEIQNKIAELGMENVIYMVGITDKVYEWMNCCDCLVLPSLYEGLPLVAIESQFCGTPIIVSDNISDEVKISDILYFRSNKAEADIWASQIIQLGRKRYVSSGCLERYKISDVAKQMQAFYLTEVKEDA